MHATNEVCLPFFLCAQSLSLASLASMTALLHCIATQKPSAHLASMAPHFNARHEGDGLVDRGVHGSGECVEEGRPL